MDWENRKDNGNRKTKRVISISLGSSERDAEGFLELGDTVIRLERRGTDGDMEKAAALLQAYDGRSTPSAWAERTCTWWPAAGAMFSASQHGSWRT